MNAIFTSTRQFSPMFRRLQTRLTVLYAALFGVVLLGLALTVQAAGSGHAGRIVQSDMAAAGEVFDRLWAVRSERLEAGAKLLSKDFGFREAMATRDSATIASAVDNLRDRLGLDLAFVMSPDGLLLAASDPGANAAAAVVAQALDDGEPMGVATIAGAPYQVVSAPIMAPDLTGWIVFAVRLDRRQMKALEGLSALPLEASIAQRSQGRWRLVTAAADAPSLAAPLRDGFDGLVSQSLNRGTTTLGGKGAPAMVLARPLKTLGGGGEVALVLSYLRARALAPYAPMTWLIAGVGLLGMALVVAGSWALARGVTRPITALTHAAHALQRGDLERVPEAEGRRDEVGVLARGFNAMAEAVADRERRISHAAFHDPETGMPNRLGLERAAKAMLEQPSADSVFVAALSVDRFARVRGAIGHELAAALLDGLRSRATGLRPDWAPGRISTDMLGVAFHATDTRAAAAEVEAVRLELEKAVRLGEHLIDVRITAGLSSPGVTGATATVMIKEADCALDAARADGRPLAAFDARAYAASAAGLSLMPELREAMAADQLTVVHQPKYDLRTQTVTGVETLVRWTHPRRGVLSPDLFIPMAEETGDVRALTERVLAIAVADQRRLTAAGHDLLFSINLSGRLVDDAGAIDTLLEIAGEAAGRICLEITETAVIEKPEAALVNIRRLAAAGVAVSIDDYGSGLSSLSYLKRMEADELKLDRSLVSEITRSAKDALLVRSTIELAHSLGLKVVAEGVEHTDEVALLAAMGCDMVQGYCIARPMTYDKLLAHLEAEPAAVPVAKRA